MKTDRGPSLVYTPKDIPQGQKRGLLELAEELRHEAIDAELSLQSDPTDRYWSGRLDALSLALVLVLNLIEDDRA